MKNKLWYEKYRPQQISDFVFQDKQHKQIVEKFVREQDIPHLLFTGVAGTGKTTLSDLLVKELDIDPMDVLMINASDENSVDVMRDKIKSFISSIAFGSFKIVQLEEADYITLNGQGVLRKMMEQFADTTRFILTANYEHKIIPAIKSRCQHFHFKAFDRNDIAEKMVVMLSTENVKFSLDMLDKYVSAGYPDIRKIINALQLNVVDGVLGSPVAESTADYKFAVLDMLEKDDWVSIRKLLCTSVATEEWDDVYRFLYENLNKSKKFSNQKNWEEGIVAIAEHLYKHGVVSDPEINFAALIIRLTNI